MLMKLKNFEICTQKHFISRPLFVSLTRYGIFMSFSSSFFLFISLICIREPHLDTQGYTSSQRIGYTCCDLCGKVYSNGGVSRHKRYYCPYTQKAPYIYCYLCPFSSRRPDNFRTHMRTKHQVIQ